MPVDKTIMIIDDSKVSRMMTSSMIKEKYPDMIVHEASNAQQAIEQSEGLAIDFFSVDYNMPGIDGLELIAQLKNNFPGAKFVLLTANIQESTQKKADQVGAVCIHKPIVESSINTMLEYFYG